MFVLKKLYCRIFQSCMRLALPFLPYRNPVILDKAEKIPEVLKREGVKHPLIVTDANLSALGYGRALGRILADAGIAYAYFDLVFPNPTVGLALETQVVYERSGCDSLIALGGGSGMDTAKACAVLEARPGIPLRRLGGILKVRRRLPLLIAVPTTAGSGSETTLAAVLIDEKTDRKFVINDFPLIPRYAVLDRRFVKALPPSVAAPAGLDALTHAVEAYIGRSTTRYTRKAAETAVRLIFRHLDGAVCHRSPKDERAMLYAAHYAGRAFTRSYVGYVHALSHALSGAYDLPHAWTNALLLPIVLRRYGKAVEERLAALALCAGLPGSSDGQKALSERFIGAIEAMNRRYGIPDKIPQIRAEDIPRLARLADREANPLYPVPVLWGRKELEAVYYSVMETDRVTGKEAGDVG